MQRLIQHSGAAASQGSRRVLVVDDEPLIRDAIARLLRGKGMQVVVAASGEEGLALAEDDTFDVVVADLRMPGMGGMAMLQRMSPLQPRARHIVLSGGQPVDFELLPGGHEECFLEKPLRDDELVAAITSTRVPESAPRSSHQRRSQADRILLIEDNYTDALLFEAGLRSTCPGQFEITTVSSLAEARHALLNDTFQVIALDLDLPDGMGLTTIAKVQGMAPALGLVVYSGREDSNFALTTIRAGAQDYLVKGKVGGHSLAKALRYAQERKESESRIAQLAFHDQLTGLANRTLFRQRAAQALAQSRRSQAPFAVMMLDLDKFKEVNDGLGHDAGDVLIQAVAQRLVATARETDVVARFGGDEFAVLIHPLDSPTDIEAIATRHLQSIREPMTLAGTEIRPGASIGIAVYPASGQDADSLLAAADAAMYVSKGNGRDQYHLHGVELTQSITRRLHLQEDLRRAVHELEFDMFYQPQVNQHGAIVGAEALLRWAPAGLTEPLEAGEFIHVLEDSGLIIELGGQIMRSVCGDLHRWRAQGVPLARVAMNLSAKQLLREELVDELTGVVADAGLSPDDLELELTETTLIQESRAVEQTVSELAQRGFRIALDDFGTGYCSLAYLQRFPISKLKIDRSFVEAIDTDSRQRDLVGGIIQLAQRLKLDVVAEGVETEAQAAILREEGCNTLQGYLYGPAQPADTFPRLMCDMATEPHCAVGLVPRPLSQSFR